MFQNTFPINLYSYVENRDYESESWCVFLSLCFLPFSKPSHFPLCFQAWNQLKHSRTTDCQSVKACWSWLKEFSKSLGNNTELQTRWQAVSEIVTIDSMFLLPCHIRKANQKIKEIHYLIIQFLSENIYPLKCKCCHLIPNGMLLGWWSFRRWADDECEPSWIRLILLHKEAPKE